MNNIATTVLEEPHQSGHSKPWVAKAQLKNGRDSSYAMCAVIAMTHDFALQTQLLGTHLQQSFNTPVKAGTDSDSDSNSPSCQQAVRSELKFSFEDRSVAVSWDDGHQANGLWELCVAKGRQTLSFVSDHQDLRIVDIDVATLVNQFEHQAPGAVKVLAKDLDLPAFAANLADAADEWVLDPFFYRALKASCAAIEGTESAAHLDVLDVAMQCLTPQG